MIKIYFAGSIRGGRDLAKRYRELIQILQSHGKVCTEHVGDDNKFSLEDGNLTDREIHDRDLNWIRNADLMVAEVTVPSLGVGYEIANAIWLGKPLLCLYSHDAKHSLSAMISGSEALTIEKYNTPEQAGVILEEFIKKHTG